MMFLSNRPREVYAQKWPARCRPVRSRAHSGGARPLFPGSRWGSEAETWAWGVGHEAEDPAAGVADAGDVEERAVGVTGKRLDGGATRGCGVLKAIRPRSATRQEGAIGVKFPSPCRMGSPDDRAPGNTHVESTAKVDPGVPESPQSLGMSVVRRASDRPGRPGSSPRSTRTWKLLQMPITRWPASINSCRAEPRATRAEGQDDPGAVVVAAGKPPGTARRRQSRQGRILQRSVVWNRTARPRLSTGHARSRSAVEPVAIEHQGPGLGGGFCGLRLWGFGFRVPEARVSPQCARLR